MPIENAKTFTLIPVSAEVKALRFVEMNGTEAQQVGVSGTDAVGVSVETSAATVQNAIAINAIDSASKLVVESGAVVSAGVRIMSDATGRAITATGATARVLGTSLSASGAAGELITILAVKASGEFVA